MVWSIGGTINGDSRKKFDAFFRLLISGTDKDHPKPGNIKMTKVKETTFFYDGLIGVFPSFVCRLFIYPISNSTHPTHWEVACLLTNKVVWRLPEKNLHVLRPLVGQNLGRSRMMSLPSCLVNQL